MTEHEAKVRAAYKALIQECKAIAQEVWDADLAAAAMCGERRLAFLKEASTAYLIGTEKRGIIVSAPDAPPEPAKVPFGKTKGTLLSEVANEELESMLTWIAERPDRTQKYGVNAMEMEAELQARRDKAQAIQTQPLDEVPIALQESGTP